MMKCFIQGAQGVGKTSLIEAFKKDKYKSCKISIIGEVARELMKQGFAFDKNVEIQDHYVYFLKNLENFRKADGDIIFFDRSIIDVIVYARLLYGENHYIENLGVEIIRLIKNEIDYIFYIPIEFYGVHDEMRQVNIEDQLNYDNALKSILEENHLEYKIIVGDLNRRKETIYNIIGMKNIPLENEKHM